MRCIGRRDSAICMDMTIEEDMPPQYFNYVQGQYYILLENQALSCPPADNYYGGNDCWTTPESTLENPYREPSSANEANRMFLSSKYQAHSPDVLTMTTRKPCRTILGTTSSSIIPHKQPYRQHKAPITPDHSLSTRTLGTTSRNQVSRPSKNACPPTCRHSNPFPQTQRINPSCLLPGRRDKTAKVRREPEPRPNLFDAFIPGPPHNREKRRWQTTTASQCRTADVGLADRVAGLSRLAIL